MLAFYMVHKQHPDPGGRTQFYQEHVLRHASARFVFGFQGHNCPNHRHWGATIANPKPIFPTVRRNLESQKFKILVLDVGSNDLDISRYPNLNLHSLAREFVSQTKDIGSNFWVEIIICLPIPRAESKFPGSFDTTKAFNEFVSGLVKDLKHIHAWNHRGLFKRDGRYLDKHGVHLNLMGTLKYFRSVQAATKFHMTKIRQYSLY